MAKIKDVTEDMILFDDGAKITFYHKQNCCEWNYADFEQLDDIARMTDFDTDNMVFEEVEDAGFRFGNENKMFFVPCYSYQNGYYSANVDILYNEKQVLDVYCEERFC